MDKPSDFEKKLYGDINNILIEIGKIKSSTNIKNLTDKDFNAIISFLNEQKNKEFAEKFLDIINEILKKNNKQKYQNIKNVKPTDFRLIQSSNDESINKQLTELIKKIFKKMYEFKNIHELTNKDLKMIISFLKDNKNMAKDFINIIDKLLNEMYNYLYFSDYKTYIIKKFKTNKFKVVNDEGYVTDTYNTTTESTPYVYFKISKEGQIEEYNGNIIEDEDFSIFKVSENDDNDLIVLYRDVVENFNVIKSTLIDYNNIIKKSIDFGGLNIK